MNSQDKKVYTLRNNEKKIVYLLRKDCVNGFVFPASNTVCHWDLKTFVSGGRLPAPDRVGFDHIPPASTVVMVKTITWQGLFITQYKKGLQID